jgi:ribokinase
VPEIASGDRPLVVVGAHVPGLLVEVEAVPREGETVLGRGLSEPEDGGKGTNQAVAAAKLGAPVRLLSLVGDDERGRRWLEIFDRYGIDTRHVIVAHGPTDVGVVMLPPSRIPAIVSTLETGLAFDGGAVAAHQAVFEGASFVLCQLEAPVDSVSAAFRGAHAAGARTILNPAPAQPLGSGLLELTDVIVANEHEAAAIVGRDAPVEELAAGLAALRDGWDAIVTAGAAGCFFELDGRIEHVAAPAVEAVDTTGAGDQFVGALAVRLRIGDELPAAIEFAVRAAALSVTRPGTMPAFVRPEDPLPEPAAAVS